MIVRWHGDSPPALRRQLDEYADADFAVVLEQTDYPPGDLQAEAERLVRDHALVMQAAGPRPAGDGLEVIVSSDAADAAGSAEAALLAHGITSDYPLRTTVAVIARVAASRSTAVGRTAQASPMR